MSALQRESYCSSQGFPRGKNPQNSKVAWRCCGTSHPSVTVHHSVKVTSCGSLGQSHTMGKESNCITTQCLSLLPGNPAEPSTSLNKQLIPRWFKSLFNNLYNSMLILWPKTHPFWKTTGSYCKPYPSEPLNASYREMLNPGTNWVTPMWVGAWITWTVAKNGEERGRQRLKGSCRYLTVSRFNRSLWLRRHFTSQKWWCDLHIRRYKEALAEF